ncbi:hypothetical protein [Deinococcus petrolearius]|uniref:Secreted protein n=1 Tax=Deinococcus petrolearius TaxID=1751295 RepID=A0ABW1DNJ0_9DEIO
MLRMLLAVWPLLMCPALAESGVTVQLDVSRFRAESCSDHAAVAVVPGGVTTEKELINPPTLAYVYDLRRPERQNPRGHGNAWHFTAQPGTPYSAVTLCLIRAGVFELRVYRFTPRAGQGTVLPVTHAGAAPPSAVTYPPTLHSAVGLVAEVLDAAAPGSHPGGAGWTP